MLGMKNHFDISGSIEICEVDIAGVACISCFYIQNFKTLASLYSCADQFESTLVQTPKTGFLVTRLKLPKSVSFSSSSSASTAKLYTSLV